MDDVNPELTLTLEDAVGEVLNMLTGLDLHYEPELDRFNAITRHLNRALRSCAVEKEWSYYSDVIELGAAGPDAVAVMLPTDKRVRVINDDAVRLVNNRGGVVTWAYFLPRDALHKYRYRTGLWVSATNRTLEFSRPLEGREGDLAIHVPVMREPIMFRLPKQPDTPHAPLVTVPQEILQQPVDFPYPDLVTLRAAFFYAQTDPVMQPRVQTIEAQYKDMMYQLIERDDRNTDSPYINDFQVPVSSGIHEPLSAGWWQNHPHSDERR